MTRPEVAAEIDQIYKEQLKDQPKNHGPEEIKRCRALIELFLETFKYRNYTRTREMVHPDYIQHNATLGTGVESIIEFAERSWSDGKVMPEIRWNRMFVDGDYVIAHTKIMEGPHGLKGVEYMRYQNGLFVEHWDVIEPVLPPEQHKNSNGVF
ncbi:hypothetical protein JX266_005938 [Neoarthrinium moseri]|uniref:uncharacterized protein n=1 Tax=Neoarthrinium moseri TaxID=1658444 RepID=UPI001FDCD57F|nr:uncharacterized protein JN550_002031 [Neoarthrinium moseri]KAI1848225.1 hypothetical protein JX266_005938 [Neoarthrinium moseri]KAI1875745.1 hypothetical protein JN550_002031 [Neoarthrinium moseri]